MERVLIVDDDDDIQKLVTYNLKLAGFGALTATTGRQALERIGRELPDIIILDLMLPDIDGNEVCRIVRKNKTTSHIPILMLTARSEEIDRILGFELGADDYVTKPFSPRELVLRVKSILRRGRDTSAEIIRVGNIRILPGKRQCFVDKRRVSLTAKEYDLLLELAKAGGDVLTRDYLLEQVWGYSGETTSRTLDTHVRRLREKLGPEASRLETVRSVGFRMAN